MASWLLDRFYRLQDPHLSSQNEEPMEGGMDKLILLTNKLHQLNKRYGLTDLDIPQIVVVGSQSSGKSSVMERIIGYDILPKASKMATRCPIILELIHTETDTNSPPSIVGEFNNEKNFQGAEDIAEELKKLNDKTREGVSDNPICLRLRCSSLPTLTLIDLPGIIKNDGELPAGSSQKIELLSEKYAKAHNSIILAVSAANVDLANSDSIAIAKKYDSKGLRTINVLTKIDIMDEGALVTDILDNGLLQNSLGTICVRNRSQESVNNRKQLDKTNEEEKEFFRKRQSDIVGVNGIDVLKALLVKKLVGEILKNIPRMEDVISARIDQLKDDVKNSEPINKVSTIYDSITKFVEEYKALIRGDRRDYPNTLDGGSYIAQLLYDDFEGIINELNVKYFTKEKAMSLLKNTCGNKRMSYSIEKSFVILIHNEIRQLLQPSINCNNDVKLLLKSFIKRIIEEVKLNKYINLSLRIQKEMEEFIDTKFLKTQEIINNLIRCEEENVHTSTPNSNLYESMKNKKNDERAEAVESTKPFMNESKSANDIMTRLLIGWEKCLEREPLNENLDVTALENMVKEHFEIVRRRVMENVQNWIQTIFIKDVLDEMDKGALYGIRQDKNVNDLLKIDEEDERRFQKMSDELEELKEIHEQLQSLKRRN